MNGHQTPGVYLRAIDEIASIQPMTKPHEGKWTIKFIFHKKKRKLNKIEALMQKIGYDI